MKQKIISKLIILLIVVAFTIVALQTYINRTDSINYSIKKAHTIADVIKSGLTSHMVNNAMDKRDTFLKSISQTKSVEKIWIIRDDNIIKQYGQSKFSQERPRDSIDKQVLKMGTTVYEVTETLSDAKLRISIPYKAQATQGIDCVSCHNVKNGDTLGAVSIVLNISDFKSDGIFKSIMVLLIIFVAILIAFVLINKLISPYMKALETLKHKLKLSSKGEFSVVEAKYINNNDELDDLLKNYNSFIASLMETFSQIEHKLKGFVGQDTNTCSNNPIIEAKEILSKLSILYRFKKETQLDSNKFEIYERIGSVFQTQFGINYLNIFECQDDHMSIVYQNGDLDFCSKMIENNCQKCRSFRTSSNVNSIDFQQNCPSFSNDTHHYYCINIKLNKDITLVFNFVFDSETKYKEFENIEKFVENYIKEAKPEIEMKILIEALEQASLKDGLTGLYNRRYFDIYAKKLIAQSKRKGNNIAFMMVDIDHFKAVNDEYGHDIGDKVLSESAHIIQNSVRETDIVIRFGGEEFIVILIDVEDENATFNVAEKIRNIVAENEIDVYAGSTIKKTVSIGFSMYPNDSSSLTTIMKYADLALYEAKETGRNQVKRYSQNQEDELVLF